VRVARLRNFTSVSRNEKASMENGSLDDEYIRVPKSAYISVIVFVVSGDESPSLTAHATAIA